MSLTTLDLHCKQAAVFQRANDHHFVGAGGWDLLPCLLDSEEGKLSLDNRGKLFREPNGSKKHVHKVAAVNGKDVREIRSGESPRVSSGHGWLESIHAYSHASGSNLPYISLLH